MATIRQYFTVVGVLSALLLAPLAAHATGEACTNDNDCPTKPGCGGDVCDWTIGKKCRAATAAGSGMEGWCTGDATCKCAAEGATCAGVQCSATMPSGGSSGTATGGATGAAGSTSSTPGGSSSSAAGTSSGGSGAGPTTPPAAGTASTAAGAASTDDSSSSSSCSVGGGMPRGSSGFALGAFGAALLIGARRRRSARA